MSGRLVRAAALTTRRRRTAPQATRRAAPSDANGRVDAARDAVKLLTAAQKWRSLREALADADVDDEDVDDDDLVAISAFDLDSGDALSETQKKYASKIADALAAKAAQLASKQRAGSEGLRAGQALYERGMYAEAASQLETALDAAGQSTSLGGEARAWDGRVAGEGGAPGDARKGVNQPNYFSRHPPSSRPARTDGAVAGARVRRGRAARRVRGAVPAPRADAPGAGASSFRKTTPRPRRRSVPRSLVPPLLGLTLTNATSAGGAQAGGGAAFHCRSTQAGDRGRRARLHSERHGRRLQARYFAAQRFSHKIVLMYL